ncbi:MAG: hypothetical protein WCI43_00550 [Candidatus Firestonebacteria bacterium]
MTIEELAALAASMKTKGPALAKASVDEQFKRRPELLKKYSPAGYAKSVSDAEHTVQVLAEAVAADSLSAFTGYITWLTKILVRVNVPVKDLVEHLELLDRIFRKEFCAVDAEVISRFIKAGVVAAKDTGL